MTQKYFSWGDIIGKNKDINSTSPFNEYTYNGGNYGSGHTLKGDIPQGDATYDAARANMGSPWKMPTKDQCQELINGTKYSFFSMNGVNVKKFTSKTDYSKYILIPAAGYYIDAGLHFGGTRESYGYNWSTTFDSSDDAWANVIDPGPGQISKTSRYIGTSVRPVR